MSSYGFTYEDKVKPRFNEISMWVRDGVSESQIARNLGISYSRFRDFKKQESALSALLKNSAIGNVNADVENALLRRASGCTVVETTEELKFNRQTKKEELVITKKIVKELPPDMSAAKMWLTNKKKGSWSENPHANDIKKQELELRKAEMELKSW